MTGDKLFEMYSYDHKGFLPLVCFNSWRVAVLNYLDDLHPARIDRMERHLETDEVFVLMRGQGILFLAGGETEIDEMIVQVMEPGIIYNLKSQCWHAIVLSRDASVLIVENADTSEQNSQYMDLKPEHRQLILETSRREQSDWSEVPLP
jgi:ureidoglycolate hydrolase